MRNRFIKAVLAIAVVLGLTLSWLWSSGGESTPVQVTFLGYTNYNHRALALFGITNRLSHDLRGFAYVQKWAGSNWPVKSAWPLPHGVQFNTPAGWVMSNYTVWSFSGETAPLAEQRQVWLGSRQKRPDNGMIFGLPKPWTTNSWKVALYFPVSISNWTNPPSARDRFADYCFAKGRVELARRIKPAANQPVFVYGPEMKE